MKAEANIEWDVARQQIPYPEALARMEARQADIYAGTANELVLLIVKSKEKKLFDH